MAKLLFKLRYVPEDEAEEVRRLLLEHGIDIYETSAGNWRISMPAIWIKNEDQLQRAKLLLDNYQQSRYERAREEYEYRKSVGEAPTFRAKLSNNPLQVSFYSALILLVLFISVAVFLNLN
jgi:hypothetical protein